MEVALHDIPLLHEISDLDAFEDNIPDETTILKFRHLLETDVLVAALLAEVNAVLSEKGLSPRRGDEKEAFGDTEYQGAEKRPSATGKARRNVVMPPGEASCARHESEVDGTRRAT